MAEQNSFLDSAGRRMQWHGIPAKGKVYLTHELTSTAALAVKIDQVPQMIEQLQHALLRAKGEAPATSEAN